MGKSRLVERTVDADAHERREYLGSGASGEISHCSGECDALWELLEGPHVTAVGVAEGGVRGVGGSDVIGCAEECLSSMIVSRLACDRDTMFTLNDVKGSGCVGLISLRMGMASEGFEVGGEAAGRPGNVPLFSMG